jgi:hypothetical protein
LVHALFYKKKLSAEGGVKLRVVGVKEEMALADTLEDRPQTDCIQSPSVLDEVVWAPHLREELPEGVHPWAQGGWYLVAAYRTDDAVCPIGCRAPREALLELLELQEHFSADDFGQVELVLPQILQTTPMLFLASWLEAIVPLPKRCWFQFLLKLFGEEHIEVFMDKLGEPRHGAGFGW